MSVRVASTANIASLSNTTTALDGVTLADGDLVLVKNQTTGTDNGIYVVSTTGAWARSSTMPAGLNAFQLAVSVRVGTLGGGNTYICTNTPAIVGTNSLTFTQLVGTNPYSFYWASASNGNPTSGQLINATLGGNATYLNGSNGVQLTSATNGQLGHVNWNVTGFDFKRDFELAVTFLQGGSADGVQFGVGGSSAFTAATTANGGLAFSYNTFNTQLNDQFFLNGSTVGTVYAFRTGITYVNVLQTTRMVVKTYGTNRFATIFFGNGNALDNAYDCTSWVPGGTYVGVIARTGASNGQHLCTHVSLQYI